jgi:hypothetical protein
MGFYSNKLHMDRPRFSLSLGSTCRHVAVPASMVGLGALEAPVFSELDGTLILPNGNG